MSRHFKAIVSAAILAMLLVGCGKTESEVKKPVEPSLPEPQTGAAIDAAAEEAVQAEDAMKAAEETTDARADANKAGSSEAKKSDGGEASEKKTEAAKSEVKKSESAKTE